MLRINNLTKSFGDYVVLDKLNWQVGDGQVIGLIGSNGAGKSTLLRCIASVYSVSGEISYNGEHVDLQKDKLFFVSDEPFYFNRFSTYDMKKFYRSFYSRFSEETYQRLLEVFHFDEKKPIDKLSKGLKRQSALILGISCKPELLLMDESFDGLDPMMRLKLKREIIRLVEEEGISVIISSHNIRELEDICDGMALLENKQIIFTQTLEELNHNYHKVQLGYAEAPGPELFRGQDLLFKEQNNKVVTVIYRGSGLSEAIEASKPILINPLPISMEEIFVVEMESRQNEK